MRTHTSYSAVLVLLFSLGTIKATAQLDSMYTQQWNRDPIKDLGATFSAQRQIITAEQIRISGYLQLSDVFQLIDGWTIALQNGYPLQLQSNGTGSYNQQNWVLMVNGQRIEMDRDPGLDVNQLGIPVYDIERIEIVNTTGMYLGEFTQNGLIHIITKKSTVNGFTVSGYAGAETGNNFFDYSAYNRSSYERDNLAATIGYNHNKFHLNTSWMVVKDPNYSNAYRIIPRLEMQIQGTSITHQIQTRSLYEGIDGDAPYSFAAYTGLWKISEQHQIRLSSSLTVNSAAFFTNTIQHRYLRNSKNGNFIWQNGLGYDNVSGPTGFSINPHYTAQVFKPFTSVNIPVTRKANLFSDVQVAFTDQKLAPKVSLGVYKRVSFITNYSIVIGYSEMLLEETFSTSVNQDMINSLQTASYHNSKLATADFYYNINIANGFKFSFNSGLKKAFDRPDYEYVVQQNPPLSPQEYQIVRQVEPLTYDFNWINRFNIHYDIVKNATFDLNYMITGRVNSSNENLRPIPKHKFTFIIQYELPKRFTLWSRSYLQSKTRWYAPGEPELYYTLHPVYTLEAGISKKLFKEYLKLNFTARSIFTREIEPSQEFYVKVPYSFSITFNINGIGGPKQ